MAAGYGRISSGGKRGRPLGAHRVSYELAIGKLHPGEQIHHLCGHRYCVNPAHLEAMPTQADHSERHRRGCARHGDGHMEVIKSGKNVGVRYCLECNRAKARKRGWRDREILRLRKRVAELEALLN